MSKLFVVALLVLCGFCRPDNGGDIISGAVKDDSPPSLPPPPPSPRTEGENDVSFEGNASSPKKV